MTEPSDAATNRDPSDDPQARLAALRRNSGPPAQAARILTAGLAGSMVLGIIAAMGWGDTPSADPSVAPLETTNPTTPPVLAPASVEIVVTAVVPLVTADPGQPVVEFPVATPVPAIAQTPIATTPPTLTTPPVAQTRQSD